MQRLINVDGLNLLLLFLSGILAYFFPLETFILAYAILGPLHYLTEINWLDSKHYFSNGQGKKWLYVGLFCSAYLVIPRFYFQFFAVENSLAYSFFSEMANWTNGALFGSFMLAILSHYSWKRWQWIIIGIGILMAAYLLQPFGFYSTLFGLLIPTIIHVYLFTLLFMLFGAKKAKSKMGFITVLVAVLVPFVYVFIPVDPSTYLFSDAFKSALVQSKLHHIPILFSKFMGIGEGKAFYFYEQLELRLMMFLSFIYLYHYLNWFSKTTVISWHKNLNTSKTLLIIIAWSIMLYFYYKSFLLGFLVSLFVSFLHVILEFPLNIKSIRGLFQKS